MPNTPTIYAARAVSPAVDEILDQLRQYRHDHPQGEHVEHQRDEDEDQRGGPRFRRSERDLYVVTANNSNNRDLKGTVFRARSDIPGLPVPRALLIGARSGARRARISRGHRGLDHSRAPVARVGGTYASPTAGALVPARREKLTRIQQIGARNLVASWQSVPHFVQMVRVDMSRALAARKALNADCGHLSVTDLILCAAAKALTDNLRINAAFAEGDMLIYDRVNLGVAVDTPDGLVVPVVHDAHLMTPTELSTHVSQLAERARAKKLAPTELEGATFTVSNLGAYGIDNGTPVIFVPQAALMFVGAIRDEVLAIDGRVEVRPAMQIAVAYDHRGIDGATASRFTTNVRQLLEDAEFPDVPQAPPEPTLAKREVAVEAQQ